MLVVAARLSSVAHHFIQRRFVRDTLILQAGQFMIILVQGLTNILLLRVLGPERVGVYTLIVTVTAVLGLLDLSASGRVALVEISKALGSDNRNEVLDNLAYFIRINLTINGILVIGFFLLVPWLSQIIYDRSEIGIWARWLALLQLTELPYAILTLSYQCQRQMQTLVVVETVRLIVSSTVSIAVLLLGWGVPGLILSQVGISCIYAVYSVYAYARLVKADPRFPHWRELLARAKSVSLRSRLGLGLRISADKNLASFAVQLPILMMGRLIPAASLGYFSTALKVITLPQPLISGIARNLDTFLPHRAGQSTGSLRYAFIRSTLLTGLLWSIITIGLAIVGPIMILVFFGFSYTPAIPLLYPLLLQSLAVGLGVGIGSAARSMDKVGIMVIFKLMIFPFFVAIGYLLINQWGAYGGSWYYSLWYILTTTSSLAMLVWWLFRSKKATDFQANYGN